jgi:hypothetical protein
MAAMRCEPLRSRSAHYNAVPADKCLLRCPRFFEVPPKDTSAELPSDASLGAQTGEDRGDVPRVRFAGN